MNWLRMRGTRGLRCTGEGRLKGKAKIGGKITTTEGVTQKNRTHKERSFKIKQEVIN